MDTVVLPAFLLILALAIVGYFIRDDQRVMARFKALTTTEARQAQYRVWLIKAFVIFIAAALGGLALLGRLDALVVMPREFALAAAWLPAAEAGDASGRLAGMMIGAMVGGGVLGAILARRKKGAAPMLGDVEAILPRNRAEILYGAALSLNAGVTEELFFRLLLPLLLALVIGNAAAAFMLATIVFGVVHLYQGWIGVLATTLLGAVLAGIYLATGSLLAAIVAHVLIDLNGLVVRPILSGALAR